MLTFLQDTLGYRSVELTPDGIRGLFYVLQGAIDNVARMQAFLEALRAVQSEVEVRDEV